MCFHACLKLTLAKEKQSIVKIRGRLLVTLLWKEEHAKLFGGEKTTTR